jgi:hypothetical protein
VCFITAGPVTKRPWCHGTAKGSEPSKEPSSVCVLLLQEVFVERGQTNDHHSEEAQEEGLWESGRERCRSLCTVQPVSSVYGRV